MARGMSEFKSNGEIYIVNDPNVADEFSSSASYLQGDFVYYQGLLYQFTSNHSGAWTGNDVIRKNLAYETVSKERRIDVMNDPTLQLDEGAWEQGRINDSGAEVSSNYYVRTGYVDIHNYKHIVAITDSGKYVYYYFFNAQKQFLWYNRKTAHGQDIIPDSTYYVRFVISYTDTTIALAPTDTFRSDFYVYTRVNYFGEVIGSNIIGSIANVDDAYIPVSFEQGRLEADHGEERASNYYIRTKFINIENYVWIKMTIQTGIYCLIYYYDDQLQFIDYHGRYQNSAADTSVPSNAKYMRITLNYKEDGVAIDPYNHPSYQFWGRAKIVNVLENMSNKQAADISAAQAAYTTALISAGQETEQFLFFTDPHVYGATEVIQEQMYQTIKKTFDELPETFILCGGDWLTWGDTQAQAAQKLGYISGRMQSLAYGKYFPMLGNHDTNYQGIISADNPVRGDLSEAAMTDLMFPWWNKCYYTFDGTATHFYVLDTGLDTSGAMTEYRWDQIDWLANKLLEEDKEHSAIAMHIWYGSGNNMERFSMAVEAIIGAYNGKTSVTISSLPDDTDPFSETYDFSGVTGRIEFVISGHSHADKNTKVDTCPVIITTNALINYSTITFDNVIVDYTNRVIRLIRQGSGSSRAFSLDTGNPV